MQSQSDKAIEIDALSDRGGRLCHGHGDFVVVVVLVADSTRYVGIDTNSILIFIREINSYSYVLIREAVMSDS